MGTKGKSWSWSEEAKVKARGPRPASKGNRNGVKHGLSRHSAYNSWKKMVQRCTDPNNKDYHLYGGRGITIAERWMDVRNFVEDMGERKDGWSIERINVDGNYEPDNCFWVPMSYQARNRRVWRHTEEAKRRIGEATRQRNLKRKEEVK